MSIRQRIEKAVAKRLLRLYSRTTLDEALRLLAEAQGPKRSPSPSVWSGNCADVLPELVQRGIMPDIVTDQTSAHDPLNGYVPNGISLPKRGAAGANAIPRVHAPVHGRHGRPCPSDARVAAGAAQSRSITATTSAPRPCSAGVKDAFEIPGFVPEYIRPLFCEGSGPFRWVALSGDPADIYRTDRAGTRHCFPKNAGLVRWIRPGAGAHPLSRLARTHLLVGLRRASQFGLAINALVRRAR